MASRFRRREQVWLTLAASCALLPAARAEDVPTCPGGSNSVRLVTGAPYSGLGTSQTTFTLPDGRRVVRQNLIRQWRDSDGRTRSEISLSAVGGNPEVEFNTTVTVIDDPTTRERYVMQGGEKVAVTVPIVPCRDTNSREPELIGPPRPANLPIKVSQPVTLGERKLEGETVAGRRIEATIPAGAMGNSKPINMSAEQWYGKDLQVVVEATYKDPRTGETTYRLRDIDRAEPDASLFRVPNNYSRKPPPGPSRGVRPRR